MLEDWTAELIADLHMSRISKKRLAEQLGYTPEYVSMVLNGHRAPKNAEQKFREALHTIINQQKAK